jgi:hypothetical protein
MPRQAQVIVGALAVIAFVVVSVEFQSAQSRLDSERSEVLALAKADHLVDQRLPDDCARITSSHIWAVIDPGVSIAGHPQDDRCEPYGFNRAIVFHRIHNSWQLVTTKTSYGHLGPCNVRGVPRAVTRMFPVC